MSGPRAALYFACSLVVLAMMGKPATAAPAGQEVMRPDARRHYEAGLTAYAAKDFASARLELDAAYALDPRPEILFAWAQAARLQGDCAAARGLFERFNATGPPEAQVQAAELAMAKCQEAAGPTAPGVSTAGAAAGGPGARDPLVEPTAARAPAPPASQAPLAAPAIPLLPAAAAAAGKAPVAAPSVAVLPAPAAAVRWYVDLWAPLCVASGVLVGLGGVALVNGASADLRGTRAATYTDYATTYAGAERKQRLGVAAMIVGAVGVVAGTGRYLHLAIESDGPRGAPAARLALGGRF